MGGKKGNNKISLEDYLDFLSSHKQTNLTTNSLNQIISMHGFRKLRFPKKVLMEAVDKIDLINISRSTLKDNNCISSAVVIELNDVVKDLNDLEWQECCVASIQQLNYLSLNPEATNLSSNSQPKPISSGGCDGMDGEAGENLERQGRKRKRDRGGAGNNGGGCEGEYYYGSGSIVSFGSS